MFSSISVVLMLKADLHSPINTTFSRPMKVLFVVPYFWKSSDFLDGLTWTTTVCLC